jgi:hypothetical protein
MAIEWIKVEKSTSRKPEVLRLASLLSIHPDHAYGLCFRFWCWCDDNLSSSAIPGMTIEQLDVMMGHPGFASALVSVGWLQAREGSLAIPNFNRHLSQSAKSRALTARRQDKFRSRNSNARSVTKTLPEERRGEEKRKEVGGNTARPPVSAIGDPDPCREAAVKAVESYQTRRYKTPNPLASYYPAILQEAIEVFSAHDDHEMAFRVFDGECKTSHLPKDATFSALAVACGLKKKKIKPTERPSVLYKNVTAERLASALGVPDG